MFIVVLHKKCSEKFKKSSKEMTVKEFAKTFTRVKFSVSSTVVWFLKDNKRKKKPERKQSG